MLPRIADGPWLVRKCVGQRPVKIAKSLAVEYFQGESYLEIFVDTSSDSIANKITSMCRMNITSLVVDIGLIIEGQETNELPEALLGCARFNHLDLTRAKKMND